MEKKLILKKTGSIRQQILDYYREGIQSGQIPIGTVLPSARSIALEHQIAEANVHCALARLAQEGWIERLPKRGSLVIKRRQMHTVAFFMSGLYTRRGERFTQPLLQKIESTLKGHGIERCQVLYDSGSGEGFELLKSYAQNKQIQGVIARGFVPELEDAFAKLPIPYVQMGGASPFHSVGFFSEKVAELMAEALARQGLRRAGILWPSLDKNFIPALVRAAAARQIEIREDWIFSGAKFGRDIVDIDEFAWLGTHYLLNQPEVEGAMFFSDDLITGAHMAFSVRHVQVGTSFKLAVHGTEENDILLPFSCPFVLQSIGEMAETLVMQLLRVANGNRIAPQTLHAELRELSATPIPRS